MKDSEKPFYQRKEIEILREVSFADKKIGGIYGIYNLESDRFYVGSAVSIYKRMGVHLCELRNGYHHSTFLQRDYNSGKTNLQFFVLKEIPCKENLLKEEQFFIDRIFGDPNCYNLNPTAGSGFGKHHSEETKKKLSVARTGFKHTEETKQKMSKSRTGVPLSPDHPMIIRGHTKEAKEKISNSLTGEKNHFFGKHHSEETRKILSQKSTGQVSTQRVPVVGINLSTNEIKTFESMSEAEKYTGKSITSIINCCMGKVISPVAWRFEKVSQ